MGHELLFVGIMFTALLLFYYDDQLLSVRFLFKVSHWEFFFAQNQTIFFILTYSTTACLSHFVFVFFKNAKLLLCYIKLFSFKKQTVLNLPVFYNFKSLLKILQFDSLKLFFFKLCWLYSLFTEEISKGQVTKLYLSFIQTFFYNFWCNFVEPIFELSMCLF